LTITFGRPTKALSRMASETVPWVSYASAGDTSMLTQPSLEAVATWTGYSSSAAYRMSSAIRASMISSAPAPADARVLMASS